MLKIIELKSVLSTLLFLTLILCSIVQVDAQTPIASGKITGKVVDDQQKPAAFATVNLLKAKDSVLVKGSLTSDNGSFMISNITDGNYLIVVTMVGYNKVFKGPFAISAAQKNHTIDRIQLLASSQQLKAVNVVAQKPLIERQIDKTVLNVENSALAAGNNALEVLEQAPGVTVDKDGNISLRGKQGVLVMLDGKRTFLSAEQLANLLRSTEGNAIQSIELITNPSSKYDAAGNSGIINIKLKKNQNYGTNGTITAGAGYGRYIKGNTGITLNHREKKLNVFGSYNYSHNKNFQNIDIDRVNQTTNSATYFEQQGRSINNNDNNNFKAGVDYFINSKNTIGAVVSGYHSSHKEDSRAITLIGSQPVQSDSITRANNPSKSTYSNTSVNLNYKGTLDTLGQELTFDLDFAQFNNTQNTVYNNYFFNAQNLPYKAPTIFRNGTPSMIKIWSAKTDYTYNFNKKTKLEAGLKSSLVNTDNDFQFENLINDNWVNDVNRSNRFIYKENINAAYANLKREFKTTTIQLGLRAEQTNSTGNSITEAKVVNRHYLNIFPTLFVNQVLSKKHEAGFSYSRRIDRPDYGSLNPFIYFVDLYTYGQGNPFLNPQYTNAFEVNYSYNKTLNATLGYSHTKDVITEVIISDTVKKTLFQSSQNLAQQNFYSLNVSMPVPLAKWWNTNNNLSVFYNDFSTPNLKGVPYRSGKLAFTFNTNHNITINSSTRAEISGNYQSAQVYATYALHPIYAINLGLSRSFAKQKASVKVAANDVFNLRKTNLNSAIPSENYEIRQKYESQVFRVTFTYRFGNSNVKGASQRSKGAASEVNRVKSGG